MIIVSESAAALKGFLATTGLGELARGMTLRLVLAFILHRGRMSRSQAAGSVASDAVHRGELTRFLARPRWQKQDFNEPLRAALLALENRRGEFLFLIDVTLASQAGKKTQNTFSTNNRNRGRRTKFTRYGKKKIAYKNGLCAAFRQECAGRELQYLSARLKTSGGIVKLRHLLAAATPPEFRVAG